MNDWFIAFMIASFIMLASGSLHWWLSWHMGSTKVAKAMTWSFIFGAVVGIVFVALVSDRIASHFFPIQDRNPWH